MSDNEFFGGMVDLDNALQDETPVDLHNRPVDSIGNPTLPSKAYIDKNKLLDLFNTTAVAIAREIVRIDLLHDIIAEYEERMKGEDQRVQGQRDASRTTLQQKYMTDIHRYRSPSRKERESFTLTDCTIHYAYRCVAVLERMAVFPTSMNLADDIKWAWAFLFWGWVLSNISNGGLAGWLNRLEAQIARADKLGQLDSEQAEKREAQNVRHRAAYCTKKLGAPAATSEGNTRDTQAKAPNQAAEGNTSYIQATAPDQAAEEGEEVPNPIIDFISRNAEDPIV